MKHNGDIKIPFKDKSIRDIPSGLNEDNNEFVYRGQLIWEWK